MLSILNRLFGRKRKTEKVIAQPSHFELASNALGSTYHFRDLMYRISDMKDPEYSFTVVDYPLVSHKTVTVDKENLTLEIYLVFEIAYFHWDIRFTVIDKVSKEKFIIVSTFRQDVPKHQYANGVFNWLTNDDEWYKFVTDVMTDIRYRVRLYTDKIKAQLEEEWKERQRELNEQVNRNNELSNKFKNKLT